MSIYRKRTDALKIIKNNNPISTNALIDKLNKQLNIDKKTTKHILALLINEGKIYSPVDGIVELVEY